MLKRSCIIILFYGDKNGTLKNNFLDGIKSNIYVFILSIMLKHYVLILSKIILKVMLSASKWPQIHRCYYNLLLLIHRFQITYSHILNSTNSPLHYIINISHLFKWLHIIVHRATESKFKWSQSVSCSVVSNSFDILDYSSPGSSVHGIFQARIREWVVISLPRDLPDAGIEPHLLCLLHWQVDSLLLAIWEACSWSFPKSSDESWSQGCWWEESSDCQQPACLRISPKLRHWLEQPIGSTISLCQGCEGV